MVFKGLTITFILIILSFFKPSNKYLFLLNVFWIWLIQAFNAGGMDYSMNEYIYLSGGVEAEWLSRIIINFFLKHSFEYWIYKLLMTSICLFIWIYVIYKISRKPNIAIALYMIFLWTDATIQCRYFWAISFVLLGFYLWYKKRSPMSFFILCLIGTGFHIATIVYFLFLVKFPIKKLFSFNFCIFIATEAMISLNLDAILAKIGGGSYLSTKILNYVYIDNYSSILVGIAFILFYSSLFIALYYLLQNKNEKTSLDIFVLRLVYTCIFLLPGLLYNSNVARFFRPIFLIGFTIIADMFHRTLKLKWTDIVIDSFLLEIILVAIILHVISHHLLIDTLFKYNLIYR